MRRTASLRAAVAAAALVAASLALEDGAIRPGTSPAEAQEPPVTLEVSAAARWTAGEWTTETATVETTIAVVAAPGGAPGDSAAPQPAPPVVTTVASRLVRRCAAADTDGRPSKMLVHVASWLASGGGAPEDRSLEGAVLDLQDDGWTLVRRVTDPSPRALAWLAAEAVLPATWCETAAAAVLAPRRVAIGDTWKPDAEKAARLLRPLAGAAGDGEVPATTCSLASAAKSPDGWVVRVEHRAAAPADAKGAEISGAVEGVPGAWHRTGKWSSSMSRSEAGDGRTTRRTSVRVTASCEAGGDFPAGSPGGWLTESGIAKAAKGDAAGAISDFTTAIEVEPLRFAAWYRRAVARAEQRDRAGAIEDFTRAIEIEPRDAAAWAGRAAAHWASNQVDDAISDWTSAIKLDPGDAKSHYHRGAALAYQKRFDDAIADYDRAIALDPRYAAAWNNRGISRDLKGDAKGALADYTKATEIDPAFVAAWFNRGRGKSALGDFEGAIDDCTKAIELNPKYVAAWNTRGNSRSEMGDHEGAVADWNQTLALDPHHPQARFAIARTKFLPGLPSAPVVAELRKSLETAQNQDFQRLWLWLARARGGEEAAATAELKEYVAKRTGPDADPWYAILARMLTGEVLDDYALGETLHADPKVSAQRLCEAAFYSAMLRVLRGDVPKAVEILDRAIATDVTTYIEWTEARRWRPALLLGATTMVVRPAARAAGSAGAAKGGALTIVSPDPKGAAALAGLAHGDVVVKLDGAPLQPGQLESLLRTAQPGTRVKLEVLRKSKRIAAEVTLGATKK